MNTKDPFNFWCWLMGHSYSWQNVNIRIVKEIIGTISKCRDCQKINPDYKLDFSETTNFIFIKVTPSKEVYRVPVMNIEESKAIDLEFFTNVESIKKLPEIEKL